MKVYSDWTLDRFAKTFFVISKNAGQFYVTFWWINKCYITNIAPPGASPKPGKWGVPEKSFQNALQKCLFQVDSAHQSKVMAKFCLVK